MKFGYIGDIHWSQNSSIIRSRGSVYSTRLENLISSVNWAEDLCESLGCKMIVQAGDFLDRPDINAEEVSAMNELKFSKLDHNLVVGNHELGSNDLLFNSANVLGLGIYNIFYKPTCVEYDDCFICYLPYILESNRKPLEEYLTDDFKSTKKNKIILSHNDILGMQMGQFVSTSGFSIEEIQNNCDLFLNGHLHNGGKVANKIFNIGDLSGQNFSEDAFKYDHCIFIIDTSTLSIEAYENPFAFNFYKLDTTESTIDLSKLKNNAVITIKCNEDDVNRYRQEILNHNNIIESRMIVEYKSTSPDGETTIQDLSVDHLSEFNKFILDTIGTSDIVKEELAALCT